ncbi:MAG: DUF126 domain-containing protein [Candidatus Lokiarchaeota archaeon]
MIIHGKSIVPGKVKGKVIVSDLPISFLGDVDPINGIIVAEGHPLKGTSIKNRIFAFPCGKGSTVGSYIIYQLKKNNVAPKAIVNETAEAIVAVGAIISEIPMISNINIKDLTHNSFVKIDAEKAIIEF